MNKFNRKRAVEKILVASNNRNLPAAGTVLVTAGGVVNLLDGQLGVFSGNSEGIRVNNTALLAGETITEAPEIFIAQGTAFSAAPGPGSQFAQGIYNPTYIRSENIIGTNGVIWTGRAYLGPVLDGWVIGKAPAAVGEIVAVGNTEYAIDIAFHGRRMDESYSTATRKEIIPSFLTPDYTVLGTVSPRDHLIQNLVSNINKYSQIISTGNNKGRLPIIAFAIDKTGAATGVTLTALSTPNTNTGYGFNTSVAMSAAFAAIVTNATDDLTGTAKVIPINLATAGGAASTNEIIIMGLDEFTAFEDRVPQIKTRLDLSLSRGFSTSVFKNESSNVQEEEGGSRAWHIFYRDTFGQRKLSQNRGLFPIVNMPDYIVDGATYDVYVIEHYGKAEVTPGDVSVSPQKTIILVPTADGTTETSLEAVLNPWFASTPTANADVNL